MSVPVPSPPKASDRPDLVASMRRARALAMPKQTAAARFSELPVLQIAAALCGAGFLLFAAAALLLVAPDSVPARVVTGLLELAALGV